MTTDPGDDSPEVRRLLDAVPPPAVPPVDVAAIYRAGFDRQARSARRWKRATIGAGLAAAGLFVAAVVPKLEVRVAANELVVRCGPPDPAPGPLPRLPDPPSPPTGPDPATVARLDQLDRFDAQLKSLEDLLLTLAADVDDRDKTQREQLAAVRKQLRGFEAATREQFRQTDQTNSALYTAVFDKPSRKE